MKTEESELEARAWVRANHTIQRLSPLGAWRTVAWEDLAPEVAMALEDDIAAGETPHVIVCGTHYRWEVA